MSIQLILYIAALIIAILSAIYPARPILWISVVLICVGLIK